MDAEIKCNNCWWEGDSTMLVSSTGDLDDPCNKCPLCGSDDIEDVDEDIIYP